MINSEQLKLVKNSLKRIFSLPITRSTFKEVQSTIFNAVDRDQDNANSLLESLMTGEMKQNGETPPESRQTMESLIDEFCIPTRLSRDILEKGEFINFMSSDLLRQGNTALFTNYVRRVDGEQFQFFAEPEGFIRLLEHFTGRLEEIQRIDKSKKFLKGHAEELEKLKERIDQLIS